MVAEGASLKCPCGHAYPRPSDPTVQAVCPSCRRPATTITPAEAPDPTVGLDKILIEKGWVTPDQIKAALARQEEEAKQGRQMRLGEALVALGWAKPEQIREALTVQGRTPMHCPTCKKTFNIKVPKPGMRVMCKTCRVPLAVPGSITDLHADETGTGAQPSFVGESAEPALTDLIPGYTIERKISTGGMGEVFLGKQKALDRAVAIKLLTQDLARDATYVQRFMAEARSAARLRHENIVAAVDAGETKGRYYFVMEYVQGETVQQIVKRDGPLSEHRALEMARQIARGLKHAHQQGLIHRDIKSANIMIGLDGIAKICDFGLAREIKVDVSVTQPGMVHASPAYASPEQCRAVKLDHRSDMYSLGVTLFEMMTAHLPFKADVPSALFVAHATQPPPTVKSLNPAVSQAASQLVARLLRKTPEGRFKDYDELLAAIDQVEKSPVSGAPVKTSAPSGPGGLGPGAKWAVAGVAATFLVVLAVALLKKGRAAENPLGAPVAAEEKGPDKLLRDARAFESARWGKPSEYPTVRARWKGLVDQFRGTPQHNQFAGPLLEFEARVEQEADAFAKDLEEKAKTRIDGGKISVALGQLRTFPPGYEGTPAAARISGLVGQLEKNLDGRLSEGKEQCWSLIAAEKFEDARKAIDDLRVALGYVDENGPQFAKPSHREELESLDRKLEEERLFARKRAAEAAAKNAPKPAPPEPPKPTPKADPAPLVLPADPVPVRRPAPAGAELKQAEDLVRDLFKEQYARKTPAARVELARKMFDLAKQTKDDPAGKFVLYRESRDLAASGGEPDLAYRAIDELAREYEINASSMKTVVLSELTLNARTPEECKAAANAFLRLADESIEAKDYAGGERAAGNAVQMARRAKDIPLVAKANAKAKECADLKANPDKPAAPKSTAAGELDLLSRIEPAADSLQGAWKVSEGKLVSPLFLEPKFASCAVPYVPPEEYDLTLVAERRTGRSSLAVGLVAGGKQFDLELDGFEGASGRAFSGLDRVDGVWPPKGETAFRGGIFADHASHTVVVRVRKTSIVIVLDGQQVMSWTADYRRVSAPHPLITVKSADSLFLAAWQSEYVIHRLALKPVSGQGKFSR